MVDANDPWINSGINGMGYGGDIPVNFIYNNTNLLVYIYLFVYSFFLKNFKDILGLILY